MKKIFISYSREDSQIAQSFKNELISQGFVCFIDEDNLPVGVEWLPAIQSELNSSDIYLIIISKNSLESKWVRLEYLQAELLRVDKKIQFLPIQIDNTDISADFASLKTLNIYKYMESSNVNIFRNILKTDGLIQGINFIDHFEKAQISLNSIGRADFSKNHILIWPVVPRDKITVIHMAQIEIIRFLLLYTPWSIKILVINLRENDKLLNVSKGNTDFVNALVGRLAFRGIDTSTIDISYLHDHIDPNKDIDKFNLFINEFFELSITMKVESLLQIYHKNYSKKDKEEQQRKKVINLLRPFITCALVNQFLKEYKDKNKLIVLSGADESIQWEFLLEKKDFGFIEIPTLQMLDEYDTRQNAQRTQYLSPQKMKDYFNKGNNLYWLLSLFIVFNEINPTNDKINAICNKITLDEIFDLKVNGTKSELYKELKPNFNFICEAVFEIVNPSIY